MRKAVRTQQRLDCTPVKRVKLNLECRDEIIPVLRGLQHRAQMGKKMGSGTFLVGDDAGSVEYCKPHVSPAALCDTNVAHRVARRRLVHRQRAPLVARPTAQHVQLPISCPNLFCALILPPLITRRQSRSRRRPRSIHARQSGVRRQLPFSGRRECVGSGAAFLPHTLGQMDGPWEERRRAGSTT